MIRRAFALAWPRARSLGASCWAFALDHVRVVQWPVRQSGPSRLETWWRSGCTPAKVRVDKRGRVASVTLFRSQ